MAIAYPDLLAWRGSFLAFHERFVRLFPRKATRQQSAKYLRGLLSSAERKNGWQLAEIYGDEAPDKTQRLLFLVKWDCDEARNELQNYVFEHLGDEDAIGILDETGFLKKGTKSAGVGRQYSGTAGKIENCQVGTFVAYVSKRGHALIDRRLYLPKAWIEDPERRAEAKIPSDIQFETKPEQARAMLIEAWERGAPMRWVTGDEVYGHASALREAIAARGRQYVFAVSSTAPIWRKRPKMVRTQTETGGRPQQNARVSARHMTVAEVVSRWPSKKWRTLTSSQGAKGPIRYDWAAERVVERVDDLPGRDAWLVARRSLSDHTDVAYYLSNAAKSESLETMVQVAAQRYRIEQCFEEAKGETGLDQYEVRHFQSWYRHITLSMMAHAWLAVTRAEANERGASEISQKKMSKSH